MYLGIEIGGTKLQFGAGTGRSSELIALEQSAVVPSNGAKGIRDQILRIGKPMIDNLGIRQTGVGFGGPVDATTGTVIRSFQIDGWDGFPLGDWCRTELGVSTHLENDSNLAGLGEARFGAGLGEKVVVYSNVGSGIGGALIIDGKLYLGGVNAAVAEIGHLRPGPAAISSADTVESLASGWGIAKQTKSQIRDATSDLQDAANELLNKANGSLNQLTGKIIVDAAVTGNTIANRVLEKAIQTYGWALAQVITLTAPNVIVVGGGVPQVGEKHFFMPLRERVDQYVMPPLRGSYRIVAAALGEEVVVHGALALAADHDQ